MRSTKALHSKSSASQQCGTSLFQWPSVLASRQVQQHHDVACVIAKPPEHQHADTRAAKDMPYGWLAKSAVSCKVTGRLISVAVSGPASTLSANVVRENEPL